MQCTCKDGSSKGSFEKEILKAVLNGADMGDINHNKKFLFCFDRLLLRKSVSV